MQARLLGMAVDTAFDIQAIVDLGKLKVLVQDSSGNHKRLDLNFVQGEQITTSIASLESLVEKLKHL